MEEEYRERARRDRERASRTALPRERAMLEQSARRWEEMAEQAVLQARYEKARPSRHVATGSKGPQFGRARPTPFRSARHGS